MNQEREQSARESLKKYSAINSSYEVYSTEKILKGLSDKEKLLLVDVRNENERMISFIPGSISKAEFEDLGFEVTKDAIIVPYCTIGLRSGNYCKYLAQKGYNPANLKNGAGIIMWSHDTKGQPLHFNSCNSGKQIVLDTQLVHCYGEPWAKMLHNSYEPVIYSTFEFYWYGIIDILKSYKFL